MNANWELLSHIGLWIFLFLQFAVLLYFLRQVTHFLNRFRSNGSTVEEKALQNGEQAPLFRSKDQHNQPISMNDLNGKHTIMIFSSATCPTCSTLLNNVPHLAEQYETNLLIVTQEKLEKESCPSIANTSYIVAPEIFEMYYIKKVPTIFIIDPDGKVAASGDMNELDNVLRIVPQRKAGSIAQ
ncbi:peroxiredoxin family protein [Guptibacillus algicola]|uniref:peroxiredoxin family protein n=1 Tax=Guptibacillus algicola TaxID=225844 RepID=UPI001CD6AC90|nr:redoxin domain-containing protein [Alkalihalobacillus algicola]MCA0987068.1 redoxin domain-containing protein [Alkalihalobacillus algicola]